MTDMQVAVIVNNRNEKPGSNVGRSYKEFVQHLRDKMDKPPEAKQIYLVLREHVKTKRKILAQKKLDKLKRITLRKSYKTLTVFNSGQAQTGQYTSLLKLADAKRRKEDLVGKFVKLQNEQNTLLAKQAAENLIDSQIGQQKVIEGQSQQTDPEKETLRHELGKCKETFASLKQELEAKNRSLKTLQARVQ